MINKYLTVFPRADYNNYSSNLNLEKPQYLQRKKKKLIVRLEILNCGGHGGSTVSKFVWASKKAVMLKNEI
jgi:hypothetical protein